MFEALPYLYSAAGGGIVAVLAWQWIEKRKDDEKLRLLDQMATSAKRLATLDKSEDAAEVAARAAREAVRLDEVKTAVSELK